MRTLKRKDCAVLHLTLKRKWYDMIESGRKRQEYRTSKKVIRDIERWYGHTLITGDVRVVQFALGYAKGRPTMTWKVSVVFWTSFAYHPEWGQPRESHYVIDLAERVELED